ncbi:DUF4129 domain-containing protein [Leifsonia sp. AG29]|uniref:DUF4129 domain-containing protein n=1 Tax=Leifsonia sp. AG29 TaxID=2598860 RepID=UPI00131E8892|nr:DUF4129 domain-containing protein [Leifsonia sp. AG29]
MALTDVPVDPSSPQAQDWITGELSKPEYQAAKPTWFDIASKAVQDWLASLLNGPTGSAPPVLLIVVLLVLAALVVTAFLVFGRPTVNRRTAASRRAVFGATDSRTADELRLAASTAASAEDWVTAIEEQFRAIALALAERTLLTVTPGTTATEFAVRAAEVFPAETDALSGAARDFDRVRYLSGSGTEAQFQRLIALDQRLSRTRPSLPPVAVPTVPA